MASAVKAPLYTIEVLRLAGSLPDPRELDRVDGSAQLRSPTCGSTVKSSVALDHGRVIEFSQEVRACAFGQAAAALVANHAAGRNRQEVAAVLTALSAWLDGSSDEAVAWGFEALEPARARTARHGAILLPLRALLAAIEAAA